MYVPSPRTESLMLGAAVPKPTFPELVTTKLVPDEEPIAKLGADPLLLVGFTDNCAQGVLLPTPTKPLPANVVVPITDVDEAKKPD